MKLEGSRCLLTGASGGIGRAAALELARHGTRLVLSGRQLAPLSKLAEEIGLAGGSAEVVQADLLAANGAEDLVRTTMSLNPDLDLLINCAGVMHFGAFESTPADQLEAIVRTNVLAPMRLTQAALPILRKRPHSMIVNVGSIFGSIAFPCFAGYSASKFALRGFSEALRRELSDSGIDVMYFAPRYTRTGLNAGPVERMASDMKMNQDDPADVAKLLVEAIERNLRERYLGWPEKLFVRINALMPRLVDGSLNRQARQMRPYAIETLSAPR